MNTKACHDMGLTQFELSKLTLKNLNKFKLSPTAKLVLVELTSYYPNIFPGQQTIADGIGVSKRSVERAFADLRNKGLILTTKNDITDTLNCKFTNIFFEQLKLSVPTRQKDVSTIDKMTNKEIKEKTSEKRFSKNSYKKPDANINDYSSYSETPKKIAEAKANKENYEKSIYTDKETALIWLNNSETIANLKHEFIKRQYDKVKAMWNL